MSATSRRPSATKKSWASETTSTSSPGSAGPEALDTQLEVLAVAAVLGVLVAEGGRDVPGLPGRDRVVLDEGPHDGRRSLGAQGHDLAVAVGEGVHLLAHHLAPLAHAAVKDADVLDQRREGQPVAGALAPGWRSGPPVAPSGPTRATARRACPWGFGARSIPASPTPPHGQTFLPGSWR